MLRYTKKCVNAAPRLLGMCKAPEMRDTQYLKGICGSVWRGG